MIIQEILQFHSQHTKKKVNLTILL